MVALEPRDVSIDNLGENAVEHMADLRHLQIKKFQHKYELLANCVHDQLVLRPENLLEKVKFGLGSCSHDWLRGEPLQDVRSLVGIFTSRGRKGIECCVILLKSLVQVFLRYEFTTSGGSGNQLRRVFEVLLEPLVIHLLHQF